VGLQYAYFGRQALRFPLTLDYRDTVDGMPKRWTSAKVTVVSPSGRVAWAYISIQRGNKGTRRNVGTQVTYPSDFTAGRLGAGRPAVERGRYAVLLKLADGRVHCSGLVSSGRVHGRAQSAGG
jgi:hypothetical protein